MLKVLIVKSRLEPFRRDFFDALHSRLRREGIDVRVAVPKKRCVNFSANWLIPVEGGDLDFLNLTLSWQSVMQYARDSDLVIGQQSARELTNYWLIARRKRFGYRFALWGHGVDFQRKWTFPLTDFIKQRAFSEADHWFAYTPGVAKIVTQQGFPPERITAVWNSLNTRQEVEFHRAVTPEQKSEFRERLHIPDNSPVVSYCGALYRAKRLDFLIEACREVRKSGMDLHLTITGNGDGRNWIEPMTVKEPWLHLTGPLYGSDKAISLAVSSAMVIPGVVGLAIVDSFAHECPLITTDIVGHGPEIEYLETNVNGLKVPNDRRSYVEAITSVLVNEDVHKKFVSGCRRAAETITLERMVENFAAGIQCSLARVPRVGSYT